MDKQKKAFVSVFVIIMFVFFVVGLVILITDNGGVTKRGLITAEQIKKIKAGDFIHYGNVWYPVKRVIKENDGTVWVDIKPLDPLDHRFITLGESSFKDVDSIIFASHDMNNKWQKMALEYCITH